MALMRLASLQGPSGWRSQCFAWAVFSNKCYYFWLTIVFSFLRILGTLGPSDQIHDHFVASQPRWRRPFELILHLECNDSENWKKNWEIFRCEK